YLRAPRLRLPTTRQIPCDSLWPSCRLKNSIKKHRRGGRPLVAFDRCDRYVLFLSGDERPVEEVACSPGMPVLRYEKRSFEGHPLRARVLHPDARVESGTWQGIGGEDQERSELEGRMIMLWYPVTVELDTNDTILVSFPDFPEAHTF